LEQFGRVFSREFSHHERQLAIGCHLDGDLIETLHVGRCTGTAMIHSDHKFDVRHNFSCTLDSAQNGGKTSRISFPDHSLDSYAARIGSRTGRS
jgi:hypothetical protein